MLKEKLRNFRYRLPYFSSSRVEDEVNSGVRGDWNCFNLGVQKNADAGNQTGKLNRVLAGSRG